MMLFNNVITDTKLILLQVDEAFVNGNYLTGGQVYKFALGSQCVIANNVGIS